MTFQALLRVTMVSLLAFFSLTFALRSEDKKPADQTFALSDGKIVLEAPKNWVRKQPTSRIVEHEFAIPGGGEGKNDGRFTAMGAGGDVEANIQRWKGQFTQSDGSSTNEKTKVQKLNVNGTEVHYVDITGDYKDQAGPFNPAPAVTRPGYRMLAAIVVNEKLGQYFLKFYGPKELVAAQEKSFQEMVNGLKVK